jgi:hypothetical protein
MRASINQTGRTRIPAEDVSIELVGESSLKLQWNFSNGILNSDSEGVLELFALGNFQRVHLSPNDLGVAGDREISLARFADPKSVAGRLKIVTTTSDGLRLITSESKTLRLVNDKLEGEHGKSLLDVYWDPNLRVPWQLVFEDSEPLLKVSNFHDNATKIYSHLVFQTSILPEVLKQISFWLLTEDPDESQNVKVAFWWNLLEELGLSSEDRAYYNGVQLKDLEVLNEISIKCQELADHFATKHNILQKLTNHIIEEEE